MTEIDEKACGCLEPCESVIYSAFVVSRRELAQRSQTGSKLFIYYTSRMVTNIEERTAYDSSQFLADMGGTLGFLLGLSIIGIITALEIILGYLFPTCFTERLKQQKKQTEEMKKENEFVKIWKMQDDFSFWVKNTHIFDVIIHFGVDSSSKNEENLQRRNCVFFLSFLHEKSHSNCVFQLDAARGEGKISFKVNLRRRNRFSHSLVGVSLFQLSLCAIYSNMREFLCKIENLFFFTFW